VRKQNQHFLRDEGHVEVETFIDFPLDWGLGSSSTLIYNLAQWAYVGVYELFFNNSNGSGYDIACAQSNGPIVYQKNEDGPKWELSNFAPNYKDKLSFVYLGKKVRSDKEINNISKYRPFSEKSISYMNGLTEDLLNINDEKQFMEWVLAHESFLSELLERESVNNKFSDFNGVIKSLGAWGGDFVLVCSSDSPETVKEYFQSRGFKDIFRYDQIIAETSEMNHLRQ
ncbi:MAG: GYDIA family GHMP kinase, partial [Bacteriovoracaceae bacterium]